MLLLIQLTASVQRLAQSDLHSTMLLLILVLLRPSMHGNPIYIPLCFYLYADGMRPGESIFEIYIPLCFYLYSAGSSGVASNAVFTFHYASTYTIVETITTGQIYHLHSTMLLLIRLPGCCVDIQHLIYIPLCFYLYLIVPIEYSQYSDIYIPLCFYLYKKMKKIETLKI